MKLMVGPGQDTVKAGGHPATPCDAAPSDDSGVNDSSPSAGSPAAPAADGKPSAVFVGARNTVCGIRVAIGDILMGKWRIEKILGQGGMGVVLGARHVVLKERAALKFLTPTVVDRPEFVSRFLREARVAARLDSEHLVRVTDVGLLDGAAPYMVMEHVSGKDLRRLLAAHGPMEISRAVDYVVQACEGIADAHSYGVVHRDLKPANLVLTRRRDGTELIKVLDFGISTAAMARDDTDVDLTGEGVTLGSPKYMSPEQIANSSQVDQRSDVWSLAVVLYELLAGTPPFDGTHQAHIYAQVVGKDPVRSLRALRPEVPQALEDAILHALDRERDARTPSVAVLATELVAAAGMSADAKQASRLERMHIALATQHAAEEAYDSLPPMPAPAVDAALRVPASSVMPVVEPTGASAPSRSSPRWLGWMVAVAVIALGVSAVWLVRGRAGAGDRSPASQSTGAASSPTSTPSASAVASTAAGAIPSASAPDPSAVAPSMSESGAGARGVRGAPRSTGPRVAPTPSATPAPTVPHDPLEDRK